MLSAYYHGAMNPYRLLLGLFLALSCSLANGQPTNSSPAPEGYDLEVEVVNENIGVLVGALGVTDLTGYSCSRLYVSMNNEDDFMSSVSGDLTNPTYVNTTTEFLQCHPRRGDAQRHQQHLVRGLSRSSLRQLGDGGHRRRAQRSAGRSQREHGAVHGQPVGYQLRPRRTELQEPALPLTTSLEVPGMH